MPQSEESAPQSGSQKLTLFGRVSRNISFALSPAKAEAFKAAQRADLVERGRGELIAAAIDGNVQAFSYIAKLYEAQGLLVEMSQGRNPPMAFACRAGPSAVAMINALIAACPQLIDAPMNVPQHGLLTPIQMCLKAGDWSAAMQLAERLPLAGRSGSLFNFAVSCVAHRDGRALNDASAQAAFERVKSGEPLPESAALGNESAKRLADWRQALPLLEKLRHGRSIPVLMASAASSGDRSPSSWMDYAVPNDYLMRYLGQLGADVNELSDSGETALHFAARSFDLYSCLTLADMGANVNARSKAGIAPLEALAQHLSELSLQPGQARFNELKARAYKTAGALLRAGASFIGSKGQPLFADPEACGVYPPGVDRSAAAPVPGLPAPAPLDAGRALSTRRVLSKVKARPGPQPPGPAPNPNASAWRD